MRLWRGLLIYCTVVFLGGALLAPWLHAAMQSLAHVGVGTKLAAQPFHRYVHRSMLGLAILLLPWLAKQFELTSLRELGFRTRLDWKKECGGGFLLGFTMLALIAFSTLLAGARTWNHDATLIRLLLNCLGSAFVALIVACIEEALFRGVLFGGFKKTLSWPGALALSAGIYAMVHFFDRPPPQTEVHWFTGIETLALMVRGFTDLHQLIPAFITLWIAGGLLGLAVQRRGSLHFAIGLHAGWIFWLRAWGFLTQEVPGANPTFWGSSKLIDGWAAGLLMAVAFGVALRWLRDPQISSTGFKHLRSS